MLGDEEGDLGLPEATHPPHQGNTDRLGLKQERAWLHFQSGVDKDRCVCSVTQNRWCAISAIEETRGTQSSGEPRLMAPDPSHEV